jgi:hypothetical protein
MNISEIKNKIKKNGIPQRKALLRNLFLYTNMKIMVSINKGGNRKKNAISANLKFSKCMAPNARMMIADRSAALNIPNIF